MPPRILLVDDEAMVRALITSILIDEGYEVVAVGDGWAALDAARKAQTGFDLVITNSWLPNLSGSEVIARVRRWFPDLPVLHIDDVPSSRSSSKDLPKDLSTVFKPFSLNDLKEAVHQLLTKREESQSAG